jgi:hypothetical protein
MNIKWACYDYYKQPGFRQVIYVDHDTYPDVSFVPGSEDVELVYNDEALLKSIYDVVPYLPMNKQTILQLYFKYGFSYKQIAKRYGANIQTISSDVHEALAYLKKVIHAKKQLTKPISQIGKFRATIGSKEEFLYRRLAIQAARSRAQKDASFNRGQHGRRRKLKPLQHFRDREWNYVQQRLHVYSRQLIDLCVKHRAGSLILVGQTEKEAAAVGEEFVLRNWSYYALKEKIQYKASKAGVLVITE